VRLGNPNLANVRGKGSEGMKLAADRFASNILPIVKPMRDEGRTLRQIADALNERGVATARGGRWVAATVRDVLMRVAG
jgi:hypothetical protein